MKAMLNILKRRLLSMKYIKIVASKMTTESFHFTEGYEPFKATGRFIVLFYVRSREKTHIETSGIRENSVELEDPYSLN